MAANSIMVGDDGRVQASVDVVALYLGISPRRVQQIEKPRGNLRYARGLYDLQNIVRTYCDSRRSGDGAMRGDGQKELTRLNSAKASIAELDLAERRGELINAEAVHKQDHMLGLILRNNLQTMPDRIAALVAASTNAAECHRLIAAEVHASLVQIVENISSVEIDEADLDVNRQVAFDQLEESAKSVSQETNNDEESTDES